MTDIKPDMIDQTKALRALSEQCFVICLQAVSRGEVQADKIMEVIKGEDDYDGFDKGLMLRVARTLGFKAKTKRIVKSRLRTLPKPFLLQMQQDHYILILDADSSGVTIFNPIMGQATKVDVENIIAQWAGHAILFSWNQTKALKDYLFGWKWFLQSLYRYRVPLRAVLVFSFFLQLAHFITPLFFQVVVDKVIVHRAPSTLDVLALGLGGVYLFEVILNILRGYVFPHTTNRIDVELGTKVFSHLLKLPVTYFDGRRVGDTIARLYEVENIRNFITGSALTLLVDSFFAIALIMTLFFYSTLLGWIVVGTLPVYITLSLIVVPYLRTLMDEKFNRGAMRQSYLVEMVTGINTIKAMAVEKTIKQKWDNLLASYVTTSFNVTKIGNVVDQLAQLTSKGVLLAVLYFDAKEVMAGRMSVGELVAFNMLTQQLTEPILKLVATWQQFQQASISMHRIGDLLNAKPELDFDSRSAVTPPLKGAISFQNVTFRYSPERENVIKKVSLNINQGEFIGIVGTSGSGKSTLTKLLQALYKPNEGRVLIDNLDISLLQPESLRRQIGVVLQENILFNATIAENISFGHPEHSFQDIVRVAELAGAHEFILELPQAYNTEIGERGASLSGGQRQRIAIARALINNPPILIFDEATSALDYETEKKIQDNMAKIAEGRTVIVIAHRLSTVRYANRIVVFEKGVIEEIGSHDELIRANGRYAELYNIQSS